MKFICGEDRNQMLLMPERVEDYVADDNPVRVIDTFINGLNLIPLGFSNAELKDTGRPPYNPREILKLYVYGYINRIRSSRRLEKETTRNLEVLWLLCKLSPDHKTISDFRRDNSKALKNVFRCFVKLCVELGLYGKELAAIDGSKFKAVNSKECNFNEKKLSDRLARIEAKIQEYLKELEANDHAEDKAGGEKSAQEITAILNDLMARKEQYQGYVQELAQSGQTQKSLTDPDSRLMKGNGKMDVCYNVQSAVDSKNKMIVEFEVTNQGNDLNQAQPMAAKVQEMLETKELAVTADGGYDSVQDIVACMDSGVSIHVAGTDFDICVPAGEEEKVGGTVTTHKNGRCVYFSERNIVLCPMGQVLHPGFYSKSRKSGVYSNHEACQRCTCKCTKESRGKRHDVSMTEDRFIKEYDEKNLKVKQVRIKADKSIIRQRKSIVEHPFGTIKRGMDAGYCLTKGIHSVAGEFSLAFLAYNIKRAINILGCAKLIEKMA